MSSVAISSHGGEERKTERMKYRADRATTSSPGQITTQRRERERGDLETYNSQVLVLGKSILSFDVIYHVFMIKF